MPERHRTSVSTRVTSRGARETELRKGIKSELILDAIVRADTTTVAIVRGSMFEGCNECEKGIFWGELGI